MFIPTLATLSVLGLILGSADPSAGQRSSASPVAVAGVVMDHASGSPVAGARVRLLPPDGPEPIRDVLSDENGRFWMGDVRPDSYRVQVEAFGFQDLDHPVRISAPGPVDVRIEIVPEALVLDPVVVTVTPRSRLDRVGFYERREHRIGVHLTRDEILRRTMTYQASEVFQSIPGARVARGQFGERSRVLFRGGCEPDIFVDGAPTLPGTTVDEVLLVPDLEGLEVYRGITAPAQFRTRSGCGAVVAWTRQPGGGQAPLNLTRALVGVSAVLSAIVIAF